MQYIYGYFDEPTMGKQLLNIGLHYTHSGWPKNGKEYSLILRKNLVKHNSS